MENKESSSVLWLREAYEKSGLTKVAFAKQEGIEYWKAAYALRKGLELKNQKTKSAVGFKKIVPKSNDKSMPLSKSMTVTNKLIIRTSYGSVIEIPL